MSIGNKKAIIGTPVRSRHTNEYIRELNAIENKNITAHVDLYFDKVAFILSHFSSGNFTLFINNICTIYHRNDRRVIYVSCQQHILLEFCTIERNTEAR